MIGLRRRIRTRGYTYIGLLFFVFLTGMGLAVAGHWWHMEVKREREQELLFVGEQFRKAIASYYAITAGKPQYPQSLDDLIEDKRHPAPLRHLRRLYRDPMTGEAEWELIKEHDRIVGVSSRSREKPIKTAGFPERYQEFASAPSYAEWRFVHRLKKDGDGVNPATTPIANPTPNPTLNSTSNPTSNPTGNPRINPVDDPSPDPSSPDDPADANPK